MDYNIENAIKRLKQAQKEGKELINESELIKICTPQINFIDQQINDINRVIDKAFVKKLLYDDTDFRCISFSLAENLTGISRKTFYRWKEDGIIKTFKVGKREFFNLIETERTLKTIKHIKSNNNNTK